MKTIPAGIADTVRRHCDERDSSGCRPRVVGAVDPAFDRAVRWRAMCSVSPRLLAAKLARLREIDGAPMVADRFRTCAARPEVRRLPAIQPLADGLSRR